MFTWNLIIPATKSRPIGQRSRGRLLSLAFKFCNPAGVLPKLDVVTVNHSLGTFPSKLRTPCDQREAIMLREV